MHDNPGEVSTRTEPIEVFVVNYAGGKVLISCIESLLASDYASLKINVIENNSNDEAIGTIRRKYPHVGIIESTRNVGYAGAMHIAAAECSSNLLVICNNDLVFTPDCIAGLARAHLSSGAAAVSAEIVNPHETELESNFNATLNPLFFLVHGVFSDRTRAVYPSGACFLIRLDVLRECLPPPEMFLYYEDVFLGMTMRMRGHEIIQADDAAVHHEHGYSVASVSPYKLTFYRERNRHLCMFTFYSGLTLAKLFTFGPAVAMARMFSRQGGRKSFAGALIGWLHSSLSLRYIGKLRRSLKGCVRRGEDISAGYFTSRLVPEAAGNRKLINRFGKFAFRLLRVRTMD